ncbi:cytochrome P450 [Whalleya microplaca]|nr:cytochrome P450 [Whalleya microplaca]
MNFTEIISYTLAAAVESVFLNALRQLLFRNKNEPPVVFHWLPYIGNAITYGMEPAEFFFRCRKKHGDIFTFILLGRKITCYFGINGNEFVLNGKLQDVNAEEIYGPLTTPVFGSDVVYDCPNSKLIEQKKFVKYGLTQQALESYVHSIEAEVLDYIKVAFKGDEGTVDICAAMAQITIFTAGRSLQGKEVRSKLTNEFAQLYHDLDGGFSPINFLLPWAPLPQNRRRDAAHAKMRSIYEAITEQRRRTAPTDAEGRSDMISNLMQCTYKDGQPVPDKEIAHMMITLLMAGQHTSASASAWIMLRLAASPHIAEDLFEEQKRVLQGGRDDLPLPSLQYSDLNRLPLLRNVVKETLRVHSSIHSIMRKVKNPLNVPGTPYVIGTDKILLASPAVTAMSEEFFSNAKVWDPYRWSLGDETELGGDDTVDYGYGAVSKGTKSPYLPFGAGRHRCIGEKFAYANLSVIVATMVRTFKLETLDGKQRVPPTDYSSLFSRPTQRAVIRWVRRSPLAA